jgi:hypothetical protein
MLQEGTWNMSWNWMAGCKPTRHTGIYKTPTGYRVRVRAKDPRTGTQKEMNREFEGISLDQAVVKQAELRLSTERWAKRGARTAEVRRLRDILVQAKAGLG